MDYDQVVADFLDWCVQGRMSVANLLAALREVDADAEARAESRPTSIDFRRRLSVLLLDLESMHAESDEALRDHVEAVAVKFLGEHLSQVVQRRRPPDWSEPRQD